MEPTDTPGGEQVAGNEVGGATPAEVDSFTSIDPNTLPPELSTVYRNMQGDYTRKTQEIAEYRKLGDLEALQRANQLFTQLNESPDFAVSFHQQLGDMLNQAGYLDGTPDPAGGQVDDDGYDQGEHDPYGSEIEKLRNQIDELQNSQKLAELNARYDREEAIIRQNNPSFNDEDITAIYQMAHAFDGDLLKAEESYKMLQQRWAGGYLEQKGSVPAGASQPQATGDGQQPVSFDNLQDPQLDAAVRAYVQARMGQL